MKTYRQPWSTLMLILSLLIMTSCLSKASSKSKGSPVTNTVQESESSIEAETTGAFQAKLTPLNGKVSGTVSGSLNIVREDDRLIFHVRFSGGPTQPIAHAQNIRVGTKCPGPEADVNGDGYIDAIEGIPYFEDALIPLDGDLNTQKGGQGYWPVTDDYGDYRYSEIASFERFLKDLKSNDTDPSDDVTKLSQDDSLGLIGKVFVVHGVSETLNIPDTVATRGKYPNYQTLPIACGVIKRVTASPGVVDDGNTSWPLPDGVITGETVGGSSGADDGAITDEAHALLSGSTGGTDTTGIEDSRITD